MKLTKSCSQTILHKRNSKILYSLVQSDMFYCSDFQDESNGIFVLGVGFFLQANFDFLTSQFYGVVLYHSEGFIVLSLKLKKKLPVIIFCTVMGV